MHWLAQGLRKVQVEPSAVMATQNFKRNFCLNLYREGGKILTLVACFLLPLNRAIKNTWHLQPIFSIWRPLAFLPVTLSVLSGASPLLFSSSILDTWPGGLIFKCHIFLLFHTVHRILCQGKNAGMFCILSSSGPHFVRRLHYDPSIFGGQARHGS